jgi:hypothetical protein
MKIKVNFKCLLLFGMFLISSIVWNPVLAQIPPETGISIKINTPADSVSVPSGDLTIYGISSDDDTKNCQVYADWNDMKPMQNATPNGPKGEADYSKWSFTYTGSYHNIVEGPNELTSKITCYDQAHNASSKSYSINVTGIEEESKIAKDTVQQSSENTDNEVTNVSPVKDNNSNSTNEPVQQSTKNTDNEVTNVSPVKDDNSNSTKDTVQQSTKNTANEVTNVSPVKDNNGKGKYKILPLYSESNEEVAGSISSEDGDKTEVTSTDTSESPDSHISADIDDNDKTLSSEQQEETQVTSNDTSESQDSHESVEIGDTNIKSLSSEQHEETEETTAYDSSVSQAAESLDEGFSTDTNKYFTFEPDLQQDENLGENDNNPTINNADSDSSPTNHYVDGNSVFGKIKDLNEETSEDSNSVFGKIKDLNEDTKNKLENNKERSEERLADSMHVFGLTG